MMIQLQAKGIVFGYNSSPILKDVSFEIGPSRLVTIVGPNGSGKSTLIKCIDRILAPERGTVLIDRKDVTKMDRMEIAKNLSYVPQSSARTFPSNVFDTVLMGRRPHIGWLSSSDDEERVWEVLRLLGIEELNERITALETEIARIRAQLEKKHGSLSAAEALFKK